MLHLLRVEMVINSPWIMPILGIQELASPKANGFWCIVPTGRVIVPTGSYIVPNGSFIDTTGRVPRETGYENLNGNPQHALKDKGVIESGCLRHMTRNISYLSEFKEINRGYVTFGRDPKGGKITCKGSPRENNMYNVDLKNIVPSGDLTCLFAKATLDESNLWHRRLGHIDFKTMNKLVKGNLVRGLLSKVFENNHTCVAYKKGKQHRASCKSKPVSYVSQPLQREWTYITQSMNYQSIIAGNKPNHNASIQENLNADPQNTDANAAFDVKETESEVHVSPSSGDKTKNHDEKTKRDAKGKRFEDPDHPNKVYKVVKALYRLHKAPTAWFETLANYLLENGFQRGKIDQTLFIKKQKDGKSANTPIDTEKPLLKDPNGKDVDVHTYRSIISSLMYLTSSRPDIMFAVYACDRFQVTPKDLHLHAVKRIFRYLKGKPHLGLWYPKDSPFNLVAYLDSDYAGASLDRKSTTGVYQVDEKDGIEVAAVDLKLLLSGLLLMLLVQIRIDGKPTIYVSCIKQVWASLSIKKSNDVVRLQALIDRKKVIITEDSIRYALRLDDVDVGDLSSYATKYTSPTLTQKVFTNIRRVGKGFSGVDTPLFDVSTKPTPPSPTPATPPPPPQQEPIPSPPQADIAQPSSPPPQQPL
uniref:GAG-pre-integrase domain-containing protein n=1 Tax=Tanacetum cinerariifolium TaxID=118510 RepID=A0A699HJC4_TANCI|nr:hypothetical protein [Tanacetum cinerariifolium]